MKKYLFVVLMVGAFILAACGGGAPEATPTLETVPAEYAGLTNPLGADAATAGATVFKVNCEPCHGPTGKGDGPSGVVLDPRPRDLSTFQHTVSDDFLFWRVNTGKPGTSMAPWKGILTEEQIWQAIAFIRTLK